MKLNYRVANRVIHWRLALTASLVVASSPVVSLAAQDGPGPGPLGPAQAAIYSRHRLPLGQP